MILHCLPAGIWAADEWVSHCEAWMRQQITELTQRASHGFSPETNDSIGCLALSKVSSYTSHQSCSILLCGSVGVVWNQSYKKEKRLLRVESPHVWCRLLITELSCNHICKNKKTLMNKSQRVFQAVWHMQTVVWDITDGCGDDSEWWHTVVCGSHSSRSNSSAWMRIYAKCAVVVQRVCLLGGKKNLAARLC